MNDKLLKILNEKENRCKNLQRQASELLIRNNMHASEEQCGLLQIAADLESEMALQTIGTEREHHIREKNRIDYEIMRIRGELDVKSEKKVPDQSKSGKKAMGNDGSEASVKNKDEEELDRVVRTWYKDAPTHSFDDVSGMSELKKKLQSCLEDAQAEKLMDYFKIPHLNSYFFVGPPGCGKTYIIEAFAHELMDKDYKFMSLQGSDIISRYVGAAEKSVTRLFEEAEKNAPCIIFIDEIDSLCKNRSLPNLPEYAANITTSFLTGYNRIHSIDSKVIFIAATNYPDRVDNAMLDRVEIVRVPLPDKAAREAAFRKHFEDIITLHNGLTFEDMAEKTRYYNYRDIDRLTSAVKRSLFKDVMELFGNEELAIDAVKNGKYKLTRFKFESIMDKVKPSPKENILNDLREWENSIKSITDYDDTNIDLVYEPDNMSDDKSAPESTAVSDKSSDSQQNTGEEFSEKPVYSAKEEFVIDSLSKTVEIVFRTGKGTLIQGTSCINGENFELTETDEGYSFTYTPAPDESEVEVFVRESGTYLGTFTAKIKGLAQSD